MLKRIGVSLMMLALVATACGKNDKTSTGTSGGENGNSGGSTKTYTVQVDLKKPGMEFNALARQYFPSQLQVHPGDSLTFKNRSGEPHSVTFGTLVDAGLKKAAPGPRSPEPAELKKIPDMIPQGPGDLAPVSANPCYVQSGDPTPASCKSEEPAFNGKYSLYNSGFLPEGQDFKLKVASDVAPGAYRWFCTLHRAGMNGTLTVVQSSVTTLPPDQVTKRGDAEAEQVLGKLKPVSLFVRRGLGPNNLLAGGLSRDQSVEGQVNEFGPKEAKVKVGQLVKWTVLSFHTITFNAPADSVGAIIKGGDGKFHINPKVAAPAKSPPANPSKKTGNVVDAGTWNGAGLLNSGVLPGTGPPGFLTWQVRFGKKGTYKYHCGIHSDMEGTITAA
ncbi:MAG: hypothetical protein NVSMB57_12180 [Actinomycetota bacterium]